MRRARCVAALSIALAIFACRRVDDEPQPRPIAKVHDEPADERVRPPVPTTMVVPDFAPVAARVGPSVVTVISTVRDRESSTRNKVVRGVGSGVFVGTRGQVLTNEHVVASAKQVEVELAGGERIAAKVVHADDMLDLALLELEAAPEIDAVTLSDRAAAPGEWVMAVGQPFGLGHTVTVGVIGGLGRDHDDLGRPEGLREDGIWSFIQTDASINTGNSGGPLVDAAGNVVGITTAVRLDGQGLAFAIPAAMVRRFLDDVWEHGRVRHTRLGIKAENAEAGVLPGRGSLVRVTAVDAEGPAADAGIVPGDFVIAIDGTAVRRVSDVAYLAQLAGVGAKITMRIRRDGADPQDVLLVPSEAS
ncbi:MAG TPA: trypsin-like peptidase domain-containing protein [Nannocystaceae bacterium]|nr:trypsin-like peptidase domain-containing protein [Nannocystaceae bacterium]